MSTNQSASRHYIFALTTFALPSVCFLAIRWLMPAAQPSYVDAAMDTPVSTPEGAPVASRGTDADTQLLRKFDESEGGAGQQLSRGLGAVKGLEDSKGPTARPSRDLPTGIALTSVMKTSGGAVAVIQGRLYRLGDHVTPEWSIRSIDDKALTVTVAHSDGETRTLAIDPAKGR